MWKIEHYLRHENKVNEKYSLIVLWGIKVYEQYFIMWNL